MWTVPNILSILRICSFPFLIWLILTGNYKGALILLAAAGISDSLDGVIARAIPGQQSEMGKFLDPMADKLMGVSVYVSISLKGLLPAWLASLVFTRDIAISLGALILVLLDMKVVAKPSYLGKGTTACQIITAILCLLAASSGPVSYYVKDTGVLSFLIYVTALLTITSGLDYLARSFRDYENRVFVKPAQKE